MVRPSAELVLRRTGPHQGGWLVLLLLGVEVVVLLCDLPMCLHLCMSPKHAAKHSHVCSSAPVVRRTLDSLV